MVNVLTQTVNNCNNLNSFNNLIQQQQQLTTLNMISSTNSTGSNDSSTNLAALPNSQSSGQINLNTATTNQVQQQQQTNQLKANSNSSGGQSTSSNGSQTSMPNQSTSLATSNPTASTSGNGSGQAKALNNNNHVPVFRCPKRPNKGTEGKPLALRANHFQITMPRGFLYHYDITISPDKCPRKINREIIETMVASYSKVFPKKPVFDGRKNMYTKEDLLIGRDRVELEVTLPGEGKDRIFRVGIKYIGQVNLDLLDNALEGKRIVQKKLDENYQLILKKFFLLFLFR